MTTNELDEILQAFSERLERRAREVYERQQSHHVGGKGSDWRFHSFKETTDRKKVTSVLNRLGQDLLHSTQIYTCAPSGIQCRVEYTADYNTSYRVVVYHVTAVVWNK